MGHKIKNSDCYMTIINVVASDGYKRIEIMIIVQQKLPKVDYLVYVNKEVKIVTKRLDDAVEVYNQY